VLVVIGNRPDRVDVKDSLNAAGYEVRAWPNVVSVDQIVAEFPPDVVIADVCLRDGLDGLQLAQSVREWGNVGMILLGGSDDDDECLTAFAAGGDDYLKRPFFIDELVARTAALLRRLGRAPDAIRRAGDVTIDDDSGTVTRAGHAVDLTPTEYDIFTMLVRAPNRILSKAELLQNFRGGQAWEDNVVEVHVSALRRKLEVYGPRLVHTKRGAGYVFRPYDPPSA